MRHFLVKRFALYYGFKIFKWFGNIPRISTIMFPALLLAAILQIGELRVLSLIFLAIFIFGAWLGFDWFGLGYFQIWPVKWEELDDFQKFSYSFMSNTLTRDQKLELTEIVKRHPEWR